MAKYTKRKDGRYSTNVDFGYKDDGSRNRIPVYGKTIKELEEKKLHILMMREQGLSVKSSSMLFEEYALRWLSTYKKKARTNTSRNYTYNLKKYIIPAIGFLPIGKIVKSDIQDIINDNYNHYATCDYIITTLNQIFNTAVDDDIIRKNPCKNVNLPKKPQSSRRPLSDIEKLAIKTATLKDNEKALIYLLLYCGLSRAEVLALTQTDIDLVHKTVSVTKDLVFSHNRPLIEEVKNNYRKRQIPIPDVAISFISGYLKSINTNYLFTKKDGSPVTEQCYRRMWDNIKKKCNKAVCSEDELKAGVNKIGFTAYTFRHNYATQLYYSNITIKQAAKYMGHCDTKMIMQVYAHLDEVKENAVQKINSVDFL